MNIPRVESRFKDLLRFFDDGNAPTFSLFGQIFAKEGISRGIGFFEGRHATLRSFTREIREQARPRPPFALLSCA